MEKAQEIKIKKSFKILSILISRDGFYFCVNHENKRITDFNFKRFSSPKTPEELLKEIHLSFTDVFNEQKLKEITDVKVFYAHALYALVPRPYFLEDKLSDYLKFNVGLMSTDEITFDKLKTINANLVYVPFTNINNFIYDQVGEFTFKHATGIFIDQCKQENQDGITVYANVFLSHFDLCVFEENELILCNSFDYFSAEDFVYYILFVFEQLKLNPDQLNLCLSGEIDEDSEIYELLYTYVRNISFFAGKHNLVFEQEKLRSAPAHQFQFIINASIYENHFRDI